MSFVTTKDNVEIYYEAQGQGPVIAFISGFMGIGNIWHQQVGAFSINHRVITHDNRGYGRSGKPDAAEFYSVERHAEDLEDVLIAAGVHEPIVLVTHSMGGNIATAFALKHPEQVRGIIYTGTYASGAQFVRNGVTGESLFNGVATESRSVEFFKAFGLASDMALEAAKWSRHALRYNAQALERYDCEDRYISLDKPVLIIQGALDVVTPVEPYATELQAAIPGAQLMVLDGINHFPQTEAPREVSASIESFIAALPPAGYCK